MRTLVGGRRGVLRRALAGLLEGVGQVTLRVDAGCFAGELAIAAHRAGVAFAIGAKRIAALGCVLAGVTEADWAQAIDMPGAQVAVADYRPPLVAGEHYPADPTPAPVLGAGQR